MLEPSKEDLEKAHKLVTDYFCFHEKDLMRNGESNDYWIQKQTQDIAQALAEERQSWEREKAELVNEYQRLQDKGLAKFSKETPHNDILVRDILREHLSPVLDQPQYDRLQSKFLNELNLRDREINRLKAELEPLVRERITVEKMDEEIKSTVNELEEKISRLTASLAAALEKLRACVIHFERTLPSQPRPTISELENILKRDQICLTLIQPDGSLTSHPCIEEAKKVLSDPTGQAAFEKWKRMEAAIDTADKKLRSMHERIKKCTFKEVVVTEAFPIQFYDGYNEALVDVNNIIVEAIQALEGAGGGV